MWQTYLQPATRAEALSLLRDHAGRARIVAGGTDVLVELSRGVRPTPTLIDITRLKELRYVRAEGGCLHLGALATHNDVLAAPLYAEHALPLAQACWEIGAPQIRNRATVAGNLVTASPANDTITPLLAMGAEAVLTSTAGERVVPFSAFYTGPRATVLRPDELLCEVRVPLLGTGRRGIFLKLGLRRAQAISVVNVAIVLAFAGDMVAEAAIALGCVAPTVVRARAAEVFLAGQQLTSGVIAEAAGLACQAAAPIDDVRGSASYRLSTISALVGEGLRRLATGTEAAGFPTHPILLSTPGVPARGTLWVAHHAPRTAHHSPLAVEVTVNGTARTLPGAAGKTLLNALREDAGLTGTKEGCAEGECGACTVWLDGQAVMSCLVPAAQAHGAAVTTIEGLLPSPLGGRGAGGEGRGSPEGTPGEGLHPLQAAFVARGAVQCGYCIPGMLMAGAKLLQERPRPDVEEVRVALSGNLCRCTGYRKILDAVLAAGEEVVPAAGEPA